MNTTGAMKLLMMFGAGCLLIDISITGRLGSMIGAIIDPAAMQEGTQSQEASMPSTGVTLPGTPNDTNIGVVPRGNVTTWIAAAIQLTGVPTTWANDLATIAIHESGGNPAAVNKTDSNAAAGHPSQGLMQMIPGTFLAHALPGHTNILNPVDNAASAIRYIQGRYGTVFQVPGIVSLRRGKPYVGY